MTSIPFTNPMYHCVNKNTRD